MANNGNNPHSPVKLNFHRHESRFWHDTRRDQNRNHSVLGLAAIAGFRILPRDLQDDLLAQAGEVFGSHQASAEDQEKNLAALASLCEQYQVVYARMTAEYQAATERMAEEAKRRVPSRRGSRAKRG